MCICFDLRWSTLLLEYYVCLRTLLRTLTGDPADDLLTVCDQSIQQYLLAAGQQDYLLSLSLSLSHSLGIHALITQGPSPGGLDPSPKPVGTRLPEGRRSTPIPCVRVCVRVCVCVCARARAGGGWCTSCSARCWASGTCPGRGTSSLWMTLTSRTACPRPWSRSRPFPAHRSVHIGAGRQSHDARTETPFDLYYQMHSWVLLLTYLHQLRNLCVIPVSQNLPFYQEYEILSYLNSSLLTTIISFSNPSDWLVALRTTWPMTTTRRWWRFA